MRPLGEYAVGRLGIHVDELIALFHGDEIVGRAAVRVGRPLQIHCGGRRQQLPTAARVLHMADHRLPAGQRHMGDESVGAGQEAAPYHLSVLHALPPPLMI